MSSKFKTSVGPHVTVDATTPNVAHIITSELKISHKLWQCK
jgi:hypothetical protein